jgi:putative transposase
MKANQAVHSVRAMCRALDVSRSGFYTARTRAPSARAVADAELSSRIRVIHNESRGTYGMPRVHAELAAGGVRISFIE